MVLDPSKRTWVLRPGNGAWDSTVKWVRGFLLVLRTKSQLQSYPQYPPKTKLVGQIAGPL